MSLNSFNTFGDTFVSGNWRIVFGYRHLEIEDIKRITGKEICLLKQVHGDQLVYASPKEFSVADAHWTQQKEHLLIIKTADCQPIIMIDHSTEAVVAIHAGWRGVEQQITLKTLQRLAWNPSATKVFIGPHILMKSFEVQETVARSLMLTNAVPNQIFNMQNSLSSEFSEFIALLKFDESHLIIKQSDKYDDKFRVNLYLLTLWQLFRYGIKPNQVTFLDRDTMTDKKYWSYRREKNSSEKNSNKERQDGSLRNYSFIYYSTACSHSVVY